MEHLGTRTTPAAVASRQDTQAAQDGRVRLDTLYRWRAAIADLDGGASTKYSVCVVGDSITEGAIAGTTTADYRDKGFVGRLRAYLAARYEDVGQGFIAAYYPFDYPQWSYTGTGWGFHASFGVGGRSRFTSTANDAASVTFTGTGCVISFIRGGVTGNVRVTIDGTVYATVDTYTSGAVDNYWNYTVSGLSDGPHTLTLTNLGTSTAGGAAGNSLYFNGLTPVRGARGVIVHNIGSSGAKASTLTPEAYLQAELQQFAPTLTIIALTANDYTQQTAIATYTAELTTLVNRAKTYGDVLLVANGARSVITGQTIPQASYVAAMRAVADATGVAFVSLVDRWGGGPNAVTLGYLNADGLHPNVKGHADQANALAAILLDVPVRPNPMTRVTDRSITHLTADVTNTTTTLADVRSDFTQTLEPNATYRVEFYVPYSTAATTTGIGLTLTTSAAPTLLTGSVDIGGVAANGTASIYSGAITASAVTVASAAVAAANTIYIALVTAVIRTGASSVTVRPQFRSSVAGSGATIRAGAHLELTRVA
ncbi:SGNH/GDSL hydrolase family protein [Deinococcus pimensis]|uniref:SGNH/GDSL hydrolase family protein n=1 Tax=Deinococcus pimensis TaxID=309888 RepID=UPI0004819FB1|nr:SGNH/GDSL hydrolase family protein [Deinococcus pimensis]